MKCFVGFLLLAICALQMISAWPVRSGGMVFYQPDYYNAHRAFVMQYASQPVRSYRRQGQAAGVSAYASGKKIGTKTYLKQSEYDQEEEEPQYPPGGAQSVSVAEAHPEHEEHEEQQHDEEEPQRDYIPANVPAVANDVVPVDEEETPEVPAVVEVPKKHKKTQRDEVEDDDDDEDENDRRKVRPKNNNKNPAGSYFPVSFGNTNGGAIAIANSYSTGKGGTASSRATAYGSPAKSPKNSKRRNNEQQ